MPTTEQLTLTQLPPLGTALAGGIFVGVVTQPDGAHVAVALLPDHATDVTWQAATEWAQGLNAQLPTRQMMCAIRANTEDRPQTGWHWTCETDEEDASYAWLCGLTTATSSAGHESYQGAAVAVRLIQLTA